MPICGFELNCQLHVISIFNVCFWFLYFLLPLCIPLCAPNLQFFFKINFSFLYKFRLPQNIFWLQTKTAFCEKNQHVKFRGLLVGR